MAVWQRLEIIKYKAWVILKKTKLITRIYVEFSLDLYNNTIYYIIFYIHYK